MPDTTPSERPTIDVMDVDLGGDVVIVTDGEGTIVDVNDAFVHVTGYSRQDAIGATPRLLSSGLQQPAIYDEMWQSVLDGAVWSGQLVDRHRDGSLRTHQVTLTPRVGPNGKVDRIIAVQRNLSHDLGRESGVPGIGSLHTDRSGRCVYVSGEAARLLGGDADALYAHGWRDRLFEDDQAAALEAVDTALETGREQRIDARTQTSNWLHLRIVPLRAPDGTDIGTSWSLEDVTDLIDLHRRLSRRDALVTALLESHEDPVAFVDPSGTILATNTAWSRTTPDEHPALATTTGDNLLERLRQMGADGDPTATEVARGVTAQITGVPATGRADRRLLATPIHSEEGGAVLRLPRTPGAT